MFRNVSGGGLRGMGVERRRNSQNTSHKNRGKKIQLFRKQILDRTLQKTFPSTPNSLPNIGFLGLRLVFRKHVEKIWRSELNSENFDRILNKTSRSQNIADFCCKNCEILKFFLICTDLLEQNKTCILNQIFNVEFYYKYCRNVST